MTYIVLALTTVFFALTATAIRSRRHKRHPLRNSLISSQGIVDSSLDPNGSVLVDGELWLARSLNGNSIPTRTRVTVVAVKDHLLLVD